jgi:hypothetical protein
LARSLSLIACCPLRRCGLGFTQLPNGLGFGGQVGHFAMYVDSTLEAGISRPSATYASPCLASAQTFEVRVELHACCFTRSGRDCAKRSHQAAVRGLSSRPCPE